MKRSVKIMALLLCLAMLVPQLVSCGNDENIDTFNKNTNDVSTESAVVTSDEAEEKYIFEKRELHGILFPRYYLFCFYRRFRICLTNAHVFAHTLILFLR